MKGSVDRRISLKAQALENKLCDFYDKVFQKGPADDQFFVELDELHEGLYARLEKRPITALEITGAFAKFEKRFRAICMTGRSRGAKK